MVIKKTGLTITLLCIIFLIGCKDFKLRTCPKSSFNSSFPKRTINLTNRLGNSFDIELATMIEPKLDTISGKLLVETDSIIDTVTFRIQYNKIEKTNIIIDSRDNDTIFEGSISKYRGLYYCTTKQNDTTFWIGVIRIENGYIQGLGTVREQMCYLDKMVEKNNYSMKYLTDTVKNIIRLKPDKRELKTIYSSIIDSFPNFKLIEEDFNQLDAIDFNINTDNQYEKVENYMIDSYYPNPVTDNINIELEKNENYLIQIIDGSGKILKSVEINNNFINMDLSNLKSGVYILRVHLINERIIENKKIIIR